MSNIRFAGWYRPKAYEQVSATYRKSHYERITYIGCVHGGDEDFTRQLEYMAQDPPNLLVFSGDLTGSKEMEELKRRFYNYVANRAKLYLRERPDVTDRELLSYVGPNPPKHAMTLRDGCLFLLRYQLELQQFRPDEINTMLDTATEADIARIVRYAASFTYYGEWAATLPRQVREAVLATLATSAESLLKPINRIRTQGTKVIMVEGNWDCPRTTGVRVIAGEDIDKFFDTKRFFADHGYQFADQVTAEETTTTLHIFLPYNALLNFEEIPEATVNAIKLRTLKARRNDKQIIAIGHAIPNLRVHNLIDANPEAKGDQERSTINFRRAIAAFGPHEVIYGHLHDPIKDESGNRIDSNSKYILEILDDETDVRLIEDPNEIGRSNKQAVVTYIPLRGIAESGIPLEGPKDILTGHRLPTALI